MPSTSIAIISDDSPDHYPLGMTQEPMIYEKIANHWRLNQYRSRIMKVLAAQHNFLV